MVSTIEESDIAIFPLAIEYLYKIKKQFFLEKFIETASQNNKKVFVFTSGDIGLTLKDSNVFIMRLGGFDSKMKVNDLIMPPFINDPYVFLNREIKFLNKEKFPTIGFVGHSNGSFFKISKEFLLFLRLNLKRLLKIEIIDYQRFYPSSYFRKKYLSHIQNNKKIKTNFIFRKKYRAGVKSEFERQATTIDFFENIASNAYTFCMRGGGNFSVRFYETLAMGRIPILLNTDCRLPFHTKINWENHCLIINEMDSEQMNDKILEFHGKMSNQDFINIQKANRLLWEKYFTKEGFFINLESEIQSVL
jgi:hypothetical protein